MKTCPVCQEQFADSVTFCANDGEVLEADPTTLVGQKLDNQYFVESLLGKGGMGAVYKARHILLGDLVALKVLPPEMQSNTEWLKRFQREGQAARRFRHPNAVTVHDLRTTPDGMIYMVMEYIQGRTLAADLAERGRYTAEEAFFLLEPVMSVLHAAHITGVVHRDIKPENIMVGTGTNNQPFVKLLDLGVAKVLPTDKQDVGSGTQLTVQGQLLGTPFYMSPEQWGEPMRDDHDEVDGRADLYSLAVVLHEMVAGHKPFYGLSMLELRNAHVNSKPTPLYNLRPDVPQAFSNAVTRALSKDRGDRQPNVQVFADELRDALMQPQPVFLDPGFVAPTGPVEPGYVPTQAEVPIGKKTAAVERAGAETVVESGSADARATIVDAISPDARATVVDTPDRRTAVPAGPDIGSPAMGATPSLMADAGIAPPVAQPVVQPVVQPVAPPVVQPVAPPARPPEPTQPAREIIAPPPQPQPKPFPLALLAIPLVLLLLAGGGFGAWYLFLRPKPAPGNNPTAGVAAKEAVRYWMEVSSFDKNRKPVGRPEQIAEGAIKADQGLKFHFKAATNGYLYIVGPGETGKLTTFLTAQPPVADSGNKSNRVVTGQDFVFPATDWLALSQPKETYTVIFSPTALPAPRFLTEEALKAVDAAEWEEFRNKYKANTTTVNVSNSGAEPFVTISAPNLDAPVLFEVRLEQR
jgi:serine/threonine-protein kinase